MIMFIIAASYLFAFTLVANTSYAGITFWTTEVQPARMEKQKEMLNKRKISQPLGPYALETPSNCAVELM